MTHLKIVSSAFCEETIDINAGLLDALLVKNISAIKLISFHDIGCYVMLCYAASF